MMMELFQSKMVQRLYRSMHPLNIRLSSAAAVVAPICFNAI